MKRRTQLATIAAASLLLSLAACGEEKPDPIPSSSASATPTVEVSPPPDEPSLDAEQKTAYEQALKKYESYQDFVTEISQDPKVTDERVAELATLATKPATDDLSAAVDELVRNSARVEGEREVAWSAAVKVKPEAVTLQQCETPGTWALVGSGKRAPQTSNTITEADVIKFENKWYVKESRTVGKC